MRNLKGQEVGYWIIYSSRILRFILLVPQKETQKTILRLLKQMFYSRNSNIGLCLQNGWTPGSSYLYIQSYPCNHMFMVSHTYMYLNISSKMPINYPDADTILGTQLSLNTVGKLDFKELLDREQKQTNKLDYSQCKFHAWNIQGTPAHLNIQKRRYYICYSLASLLQFYESKD